HGRGEMRIRAAAAVLAVSSAIAVVGVAGAAEEPATIYVSDAGGHCFTSVSGKACEANEHPTIEVQAGDTVTFDFDGTATGNVHNVRRQDTSTTDATWDGYSGGFFDRGRYTARFDGAGVYEFVCQAHVGMGGTVVVKGDATVTPTATATATATATSTATPAPSP